MKKLMLALVWTMAIITMFLFFYSCKKDSTGRDRIPNGMNKLSVYLADNPGDYQQVLIDIQRIEVKVDTCSANDNDDHDFPGCDDHHDSISHHCQVWDTLAINAGVYDLLTLRNGVDALLASGFLLNGKIERIKLTLGDNNSVVVDSVSYPLHLFNNWHAVYVNIRREHLDSLSSNNLQLYLDFDLHRSIFHFNGQYWLSPVLKPFGRHSTGSIEGRVQPFYSHSFIKAFNGTDTSYALPWWGLGGFKIRGLQEGNYSLFINGINGYRDTTINDIIVERHTETDVGTIELQQ